MKRSALPLVWGRFGEAMLEAQLEAQLEAGSGEEFGTVRHQARGSNRRALPRMMA